MFLYHYYDAKIGPFKNISDLSVDDAKQLLDEIKKERPDCQCAKRQESYVEDRIYYEFQKKGGRIDRRIPHYMVVEHSPWLETWYENSSFVRIPIEEFDISTLSFTYGDSHPTFSSRVNDGKEYRKKLYIYNEILKIIEKYGLLNILASRNRDSGAVETYIPDTETAFVNILVRQSRLSGFIRATVPVIGSHQKCYAAKGSLHD